MYPEAREQRCWNHKVIDVLDRLPKSQQDQAKPMLHSVPHAGCQGEPERLTSEFAAWCRERSHNGASETLERDWERMVTFYEFPAERWRHLKDFECRGVAVCCVEAAHRCGEEIQEGGRGDRSDLEDADGGGGQSLHPRRRLFRRLRGPELMRYVHQGAIHKDGIVIESEPKKVAS